MTDRTSGPGGDRNRTERFTRPPGEEWTPEQEAADRDEWSPGDATPAHRTPRTPRPDEHLPGEPPVTPAPTTPRTSPEGARTRPEDGGEGVSGPVPGAKARGRSAEAGRPGREGLTGDDRTPEDTPQAPAGRAGAAGAVPEPEHGSEGLRPGTEELGPRTAGAGRPDAAAGHGGTGAVDEEGRMPDDGLGAPAVGAASGREARTANGRGTDSWPAAPAASGAASGTDTPLLPHEETDQWERRLREVAVAFVDDPREAVEEADRALEEITTRFTEAVTHRRRTLRMSWQGTEERGPAAETDTEQLRLALRDYRELAGRLLHG
ncbi:hypothetical protein [Streptomyces sp. NRRL S-1022]|uniref:hypothetical protein n=1 Tax=Streptomyces sp. NRRL S-1022 TaxID=1463880 RepID=UPI000A8D422F